MSPTVVVVIVVVVVTSVDFTFFVLRLLSILDCQSLIYIKTSTLLIPITDRKVIRTACILRIVLNCYCHTVHALHQGRTLLHL